MGIKQNFYNWVATDIRISKKIFLLFLSLTFFGFSTSIISVDFGLFNVGTLNFLSTTNIAGEVQRPWVEQADAPDGLILEYLEKDKKIVMYLRNTGTKPAHYKVETLNSTIDGVPQHFSPSEGIISTGQDLLVTVRKDVNAFDKTISIQLVARYKSSDSSENTFPYYHLIEFTCTRITSGSEIRDSCSTSKEEHH
jgi:hypothetical protein